jgi:hypothetical protein
MNKPTLFFGSPLPKKLGSLFGSNWNACTLPGLGIFFEQHKKDVSEDLFKHEFRHWFQGSILGIILYYVVTFLGYKIQGYDNAFLEKDARNAESKPLTILQKSWIALSPDTSVIEDLFKNIKQGLIK